MSAPRHRLLPATLDARNKLLRALWSVVWLMLYRPSPKPLHAWRRFLLRLFGAHIEAGAHPCPAARIWAPWNLTMRVHSCIADYVDCYCVAPITIGAHATVSQYSYLCSASHDFRQIEMPLVIAPIVIGDEAWVAADAFIGPGVTIGVGAIVAARTTVVKDVEAWQVVAGNPAARVGDRPPFTRA